jgi:hypothetical protein
MLIADNQLATFSRLNEGNAMPTRERRLAEEQKKKASAQLGAPDANDSGKRDESGQEPIEEFQRKTHLREVGKDETSSNAADDETKIEEVDEDPAGDKTQKRLPGQGRRTNKKLEALALEVNKLQTKRMRLQKDESEKRDEAGELMEKLKLEEITLPGRFDRRARREAQVQSSREERR